MINRNQSISIMMLCTMCTGLSANINVYAAEKSINGFNIENGVLKSVDENVSGEIKIPSNVNEIGEQVFFNNDKNRKNDSGIEGMMSKGWRQIDGVWYYFYYGDGKMAANTWINGYYVNGSGAWVK